MTSSDMRHSEYGMLKKLKRSLTSTSGLFKSYGGSEEYHDLLVVVNKLLADNKDHAPSRKERVERIALLRQAC